MSVRCSLISTIRWCLLFCYATSGACSNMKYVFKLYALFYAYLVSLTRMQKNKMSCKLAFLRIKLKFSMLDHLDVLSYIPFYSRIKNLLFFKYTHFWKSCYVFHFKILKIRESSAVSGSPKNFTSFHVKLLIETKKKLDPREWFL